LGKVGKKRLKQIISVLKIAGKGVLRLHKYLYLITAHWQVTNLWLQV
jgi:hypothetical protein